MVQLKVLCVCFRKSVEKWRKTKIEVVNRFMAVQTLIVHSLSSDWLFRCFLNFRFHFATTLRRKKKISTKVNKKSKKMLTKPWWWIHSGTQQVMLNNFLNCFIIIMWLARTFRTFQSPIRHSCISFRHYFNDKLFVSNSTALLRLLFHLFMIYFPTIKFISRKDFRRMKSGKLTHLYFCKHRWYFSCL